MVEIQHLGERIRNIRKRRMMTIKILAEYTGLSAGYLSTLEQDKTTPTIDNLVRICEALEVTIQDILDVKDEGKVMIRKDEMQIDLYPKENMTVRRIEFQSEGFLYEYITIRPGKSEAISEYRHICDEVCTVLSGTLGVKIENEKYTLSPGDSIRVKQGERHSIFNEGGTECVSFWVYQRNQKALF